MSFLLFLLLLALLVLVVLLVRAIYKRRAKRSLLPTTSYRPYSGGIQSQSYSLPVETRNRRPQSILVSTPRTTGSLGTLNGFYDTSKQLPPSPIISPPPVAVRKPYRSSFTQDDLPVVPKGQVHRPTAKKPVQETVERPLEPVVYRPSLELPSLTRKTPPQYIHSRNSVPSPSVEHSHQPVAKSPVAKSPVAKSLAAKSPVAKSPVSKSPVATSPVATSPVEASVKQARQFRFLVPEDEEVVISEGKDEGDGSSEAKDLDHPALRELANQEFEKMKKCQREEKLAKRSRQFIRARELVVKAQYHRKRMFEFNDRASEMIFAEKNKDLTLPDVDLHGLTVKEAINRTNRIIKQAREFGNSELRLIVGKGNHSLNGVAKLKPAIQTFLKKHQFSVEVDPINDGVLVVQLNSAISF